MFVFKTFSLFSHLLIIEFHKYGLLQEFVSLEVHYVFKK